MNKRRVFASGLAVFLLGCAFVVGQPIAPSWANFENTPKHIVDEVWQVINRDYVDTGYNKRDWLETRREYLSKDYATKEEAYRAVRTMLKELNDPYTRFMDPKQYASMQVETSGELTGVGLSVDVDKKTKELLVVAPVPDTPAFKAGLQPQDIIQAIDGISTKGVGREDSVSRIRGKEGTPVVLTVRRAAKVFEVTLTRAVIPIRSVRASVKKEKGQNIGYISLSQFTGNAPREMRDAVNSLLGKKVDGFVLDLRFNPGGLLSASTDIASIFLNRELVVSTADRTGVVEELRASGTRLTDKPVVVLVNGGSASASEILAGSLQDNRRAVLVGTTTFGKGLVQSVHELSDRSGLAVTIAHYKTPSGKDIHKKGIKPDYTVTIPEKILKTLKPEDIATPKDPQYKQATKVLLTRLTPPKKQLSATR
ncbi:S41 family peptidase [Candidatus Cyanaurora vandensis]|uniref:S41 family peptidase n=1 Tax=Candidatus Cyanaurora vandensis TaxID=2714958 RepID=UPI00257FFA0B|nr:S41 family peptidase [Candidatus Cyanaurora vandensis]